MIVLSANLLLSADWGLELGYMTIIFEIDCLDLVQSLREGQCLFSMYHVKPITLVMIANIHVSSLTWVSFFVNVNMLWTL